MDKVRVAAYCRVSTKKDEQLNSLENQQNYFQTEISKNKGYELHNIYVDHGLSAVTMAKRKSFLDMVYDAGIDYVIKGTKEVDFSVSNRTPKFNRIFVSNTSRFARNIDVIPLIRKLREKGVFIHFLDISKTSESVDDETFITIFMTFAQQESIDKSKKVRFGQKQSAENGVIMLNSKIYGYKKTEENELEIIEEEAEVIRKIFELHADGVGIRRTTNMINEMGYRTRAGKGFSQGTIAGIVRNPIYYGTLVRGKTTYGKDLYSKYNSRRMKDESEWHIHENRVQPIISKELFEQARKQREGNTISQKQKGVNKGVSEFAGRIVCGKCGARFNHNTELVKKTDETEWQRNFYVCCTKKVEGMNKCNSINLQQWQIEAMVDYIAKEGMDAVRKEAGKLLKSGAIIKRDKLEKKLAEEFDEEKVRQLYVELEKREQEKNRLLDIFVDGGFDKSVLEKKRIEIEEKIEKVKKEIAQNSKDELKKEIEETNQQIEFYEEHSKRKRYYTPEEIRKGLNKITVYTGNEKKGRYYLPILHCNVFKLPIYLKFTKDNSVLRADHTDLVFIGKVREWPEITPVKK
ncbi:recombinase family protein [Aneurinibacillus tyrosinisolvens]|uniref:recombinase family protein n=1 Tax=Aneurinibacillus tyrosinisolvens TaxID=1443435 RepID=UPI00063F15BE|nr:recombinase family protein [Aneurinibacillus tyrosinisolvens]